MILGLSVTTFTLVHVIISLASVVAVIIVMFGMLGSHRLAGLTALFLGMTVLTSATGFLFPFTAVTPAIVVGVISLVILAIALIALYGLHLAGAWRWIYVVTALFALYLNVFVLVVQSFRTLASLTALAPTQSEPPFLIAQGAVLVIFLILGFVAVRSFHPERVVAAAAIA